MTTTNITEGAESVGRGRRLALVAALYCTQNLSVAFFTYAFLTIAQARGVSLQAIGAATGIAILLAAKFLWAPLVDRFGSRRLGHYRGWLLVTQSLLGLGTGSLALFDPAAHFNALLVIFTALFFAAGTQDIAADAAATRLLQPGERGLGNGIQSAGGATAQVIGGGVVLLVYSIAGWTAATLVLSGLSLLPLPFILAWNEDLTTKRQPAPRVTVRSALGFFARPAVRWWCLLLIPAYTLGFTVAYNLVRPILVQAGWGVDQISFVVVISGGVGILGGLGAGMVIGKLGRKRALVWLGLVQVLATVGVLPMALGVTNQWFVLLVVALASGAFSAAFALVYTISMDLTRPQSAGTDFTFFATVTTILMVLSAGAGVAAAGQFGFQSVAVVAVVLAVAGWALAVWKFDRVLVG